MRWRIIIKTGSANPNKNRKNNSPKAIRHSELLAIFEKQTNTIQKRLEQKWQKKMS